MSNLQNFLKDVSEKFGREHSRNSWVLLAKYGHPGIIQPFTHREAAFLDCLKRMMGGKCEKGFCYMNAQKLALAARRSRGLAYVEGLVTVYSVPIDHAWIELNGKVYDPTLTDNENPPLEHEYHGITVPKSLILPYQFKLQRYSPLSQSHDEKIFKKIWPEVIF